LKSSSFTLYCQNSSIFDKQDWKLCFWTAPNLAKVSFMHPSAERHASTLFRARAGRLGNISLWAFTVHQWEVLSRIFFQCLTFTHCSVKTVSQILVKLTPVPVSNCRRTPFQETKFLTPMTAILILTFHSHFRPLCICSYFLSRTSTCSLPNRRFRSAPTSIL